MHLILENIVNLKYNNKDELKKLVKLLKARTIKEMEEEFKGRNIEIAKEMLR